jgi:glycine hydroxymethyltransferase
MNQSPLTDYLTKANVEEIDAGMCAYLANLTEIATVSPDSARSIVHELADQRNNLKLIASENYSSLATQCAMANLLTDKYAEGYPMHRFYAGCGNVDAVEVLACEKACALFGCDHAYVQPHSGADANLIAYWAILSTKIETPELTKRNVTNPSKLSVEDWNEIRRQLGNQRLLGMDYYSGGHLTHGYRHNVSAQMFEAYNYGVSEHDGRIDYDHLQRSAEQIRPLILLAGYSAYPREINFRRIREIADSVGAVLMVDMAHFAGLVAGGVFTGENNPVPYAHVVTTTTHKTLRGPRGGMVLCTEEFAEAVDRGCPLVIGGPLPHIIAAKAVALIEAGTPSFKDYAQKIVENCRALAQFCIDEGMNIPTGGTDNHLMLIDVRSFGLTGRQAESVLRDCGITLNRNSLPNDPNGPWYTSGLRVGTPAVTTLGMGVEEMKEIASILNLVLFHTSAETIQEGKNAGKKSKAKYRIGQDIQQQASQRIHRLLERYPVYPQLDLDVLQSYFG